MAQSRQNERVWFVGMSISALRDPRQLGQAGEQRCRSLALDRDRAACSVATLVVCRGHDFSRSKAVVAPRPEQSLGMGGRNRDLQSNGSATRNQVSKAQVQRYTWRSYESVTQRLQESLLLGADSRR